MMFTIAKDPYARYTHYLIGRRRFKTRVGLPRFILHEFSPGVSPATRCIAQSLTVRVFSQSKQKFMAELKELGIVNSPLRGTNLSYIFGGISVFRRYYHRMLYSSLRIVLLLSRFSLYRSCSHAALISPEKQMELWQHTRFIPLIFSNPLNEPVEALEDARDIGLGCHVWWGVVPDLKIDGQIRITLRDSVRVLIILFIEDDQLQADLGACARVCGAGGN